MGTKKNRWSEKDIKTMMSMMDKNGFTAETTSAVAKKIKRSTSAVQNKYRALTGKVKNLNLLLNNTTVIMVLDQLLMLRNKLSKLVLRVVQILIVLYQSKRLRLK